MKLYLKQKLLSIGDSYTVMDENENTIYSVKQKLLKMLSELNIQIQEGQTIYTIKKKMTLFKPKYEVLKDGVVVATLANTKLIGKKWDIESSERKLSLKGSLFAYNLELFEGDNQIAQINKKVVALTDCYEIDIMNAADADLVIALVIAIDNAYHDK